MEEEILNLVKNLLKNDHTGHNIEHIINVKKLAFKFSTNEDVDQELISIASLLHDVDDYKLVGEENACKFINAKQIMTKVGLEKDRQDQVIQIISNLGFKNRLKGIKPTCIEGKIVSDADMCEALGSIGIIRSLIYAVSEKGNGVIFDKDIFPNINIKAEEYNSKGTTHNTDNAINHFFEKSLKLPNLLLTDAGKKEGYKRALIIIQFLYEYFRELNLQDWILFLDNYLDNNYLPEQSKILKLNRDI